MVSGLPPRPSVALTIAGSDSGGGAGIVADCKTFAAHGVWATVAVTAVTAQDTTGVAALEPVSADLVRRQIEAVAGDIGVNAAKTGMLLTADVVRAVAAALVGHRVPNLVVDPVLASSHGDTMMRADALDTFRSELLPLATLVTPNLEELAQLVAAGPVTTRAEMEEAGRALLSSGSRAVLVTGGHLAGEPAFSPDCLVMGEAVHWFEGRRLSRTDTHGSGCVLSAAICAGLARGADLVPACAAAKRFVEGAIDAGIGLGAGVGPVDPAWGWTRRGGGVGSVPSDRPLSARP